MLRLQYIASVDDATTSDLAREGAVRRTLSGGQYLSRSNPMFGKTEAKRRRDNRPRTCNVLVADKNHVQHRNSSLFRDRTQSKKSIVTRASNVQGRTWTAVNKCR